MFWFLPFLILLFTYLYKRYVISFTILFFYITAGFQVIPFDSFDTGMVINKPSDFIILFVIITFFINLRTNIQIIKTDKYAKVLIIFLFFIIIAFFYSLIIYNYSLSEVIRASRKCFLLLIYFNFKRLDAYELNKIIKILYFITIIQCFIYLIQIPIGLITLNNGTDAAITSDLQNIGWIRYYNIPFFIIFFYFYSLFIRKDNGDKRWFSIILFSITLLAPLHRSWIISIILTTIILYLIFSENKKKVLVYSITIIFFLFFFSPIIFERIKSGFTEAVSTVENESSFQNPTSDFSFRIAHLIERAGFIINSPEKIIFGLGFITEDSPATKYLNFIIGYRDENGLVNQVETADIAWSLLIVFTGLFGTFLYLWVYYKTITIIWKFRNINSYSIAGLGYLISIFLLSFASSMFFDIVTFIIMPLIVHLVHETSINIQENILSTETN